MATANRNARGITVRFTEEEYELLHGAVEQFRTGLDEFEMAGLRDNLCVGKPRGHAIAFTKFSSGHLLPRPDRIEKNQF